MKFNELNAILKLSAFLLFAYLFFLILKPFIAVIVLASAFAIVFYPVSRAFHKKLKLSQGASSLLTLILTVLFIILPIALLLTLITREAIIFAENTDFQALESQLNGLQEQAWWGSYVDIATLKEKLIGSLSGAGEWIYSSGSAILTSFSNSIFLFFAFILLYYYFLKDGTLLLQKFKTMLPYQKSEQKKLFEALKGISTTIFYGNLLSGLLAGLVAYIGFMLFGFRGALIWALLAALFSLIPTLGTLLIYLAGIAIVFVSKGGMLAGLMLAYFVLAELLLRENYLRGKLLEDKLPFHPIVIFFALVGGVAAFGSMGFIYGPLIVTVLGALYQFYAIEKN